MNGIYYDCKSNLTNQTTDKWNKLVRGREITRFQINQATDKRITRLTDNKYDTLRRSRNSLWHGIHSVDNRTLEVNIEDAEHKNCVEHDSRQNQKSFPPPQLCPLLISIVNGGILVFRHCSRMEFCGGRGIQKPGKVD